MRNYLFFVIAVILISCDPISQLYVKYGEAKPVLDAKGDGVIRIYFDRMGALYPDVLISDQEIFSSNSGLNKLYTYNNSVNTRINNYYGLGPGTTHEQLQSRLITETSARINNASTGKQLVILIHGYNNHPLMPENESSYFVYRTLREEIIKTYPANSIQFVEVYWDGCSAKNGKPGHDMGNSIKTWKHAQPASNNVALELRRILFLLNNDNNIVITHSLGASVITCALFNAEKFKENDFMRGIRAKYNNVAEYSTPVKNFKVGMIAPAIPGLNTFNEFDRRTPATQSIYNYKFIIGFNRKDRVLNKYLGLPRSMGSTTMGCDPAELKSVRRRVNLNGNNVVSVEDFSTSVTGRPQKDHGFLFYIANQQHLANLLAFLFR